MGFSAVIVAWLSLFNKVIIMLFNIAPLYIIYLLYSLYCFCFFINLGNM